MDGRASLIAAAAAVSWTALALRWRGFAAVSGKLLADTEPAGAGDPVAETLARAYARTAVLPWSSCLSRSVALCRALRRRGLPAVLRIGARPAAGGLSAHAWVELGGRALIDDARVQRDFPPLLPGRGSGPPS